MARMKFLCDVERCIDCSGCVVACKEGHHVPVGVNRRRVITLKEGEPGEKSISVSCMHCADAPCIAVCPVDAIYQRADGVVLVSKKTCIGCGYCFMACPFGQRRHSAKRKKPFMVKTELLRANRPSAQVCVLPKRCLPVMPML